jgi:elongator complex protein 3
MSAKRLSAIIHRYNRDVKDNNRHFSKKKLLPYYLRIKEADPGRWTSWNVDKALEEQMLSLLQIKTRRTASGVATITVVTKPWKCSSDCLYCPNDLRMPKSYLSDEPACQRAERNFFDPYLQVVSRLRALTHMGHITDKIELIILGGTWSDYPPKYQIWFVTELFKALNDGDGAEQNALERRRFYRGKGLSNHPEQLAKLVADKQQEVNNGQLGYNQAVEHLYENDGRWQSISLQQVSGYGELEKQHAINETAEHRVVGLVIETRPDAIDCDSLKLIRQLGCTKVQMGIQSIDASILKLNNRNISLDRIHRSFELLRLFGFKIHAHLMVNLYGSSVEEDRLEYRRFVTEMPYQPDEVKLYPCSLVEGTGLCTHYANGTWRPYSEEELLDVLTADLLNTPSFIRISRMVRDISAHDILAGNKKANLRQIVENQISATGRQISEIRFREISTRETDIEGLHLETFSYETSVSNEYFLQWATDQNRIVGFLRLSLPKPASIEKYQPQLPVNLYEAMIREVHIYGKVAGLHKTGKGAQAQHLGLGRQLIETACEIARVQGYTRMNVISSVGTRQYYRNLGFKDNGLYQQKPLS